MQMIFQDPFESLNSRHTTKEIIEEPEFTDIFNKEGLFHQVAYHL